MPSTAGLRRRRSRQKGEANHLEGKEKGGRSRRQKRKDDGGDRGSSGLLYPRKAARGTRCPIGQG